LEKGLILQLIMKTAPYRTIRYAWVTPLLLCHNLNVHAQRITAALEHPPRAITLQCPAQPGLSYSVQNADTPAGPWTPSATLQADNQTLQWSSTILTTERQRYFRIIAQTPANETSTLLASAQLPNLIGTTALDSANIAAQAAFLASILGAGGSQLLTTGTLQETSTGWTYATSPSDRLHVQFQSGTNMTYRISTMTGNFNSDATAYLESPHEFHYQFTQPGLADIAFTNRLTAVNCQFLISAQGTLTAEHVDYTLNVTQHGTYCVDNSNGYELLNDVTTTGSAEAANYSITLNHRWRHNLIGGGGGNASSVEEWNNNQLTLGPNSYSWQNVKIQKSFLNGKPSSLDTYWLATGLVLRNGDTFGTYRLDPAPLEGRIKIVLQIPGESLVLESWNVL
jgi:hypothetical protein